MADEPTAQTTGTPTHTTPHDPTIDDNDTVRGSDNDFLSPHEEDSDANMELTEHTTEPTVNTLHRTFTSFEIYSYWLSTCESACCCDSFA